MRTLLLLFFLTSFFSKSYAQKDADGYTVTLNKDTVFVKIILAHKSFLGFRDYNLDTLVRVINNGETKMLTPNDIQAFGYSIRSKNYDYKAKPIKEGRLYFLETKISGSNTSLYQYSIFTSGDKVSVTREKIQKDIKNILQEVNSN